MKSIIYLIVASLMLVGCSAERFVLLSDGEYLEELALVTNSDKSVMFSNGGDNKKNIVFNVWDEESESYNISLKDYVFSNRVSEKTTGPQNYFLFPNLCNATNQIVFQYWDRDNFDIYYVDAFKDHAKTQVTHTTDNEYNPSWSPDGKFVVYEQGVPPLSLAEETSETYDAVVYDEEFIRDNKLWLKNIETNDTKLLGRGSYPKISPDGTKIVYVSYELDADENIIGCIWVMGINGAMPLQLTNRDQGYATMPNWSPDGKSIVYQSYSEYKPDTDIYTISADGGAAMCHTKNTSEDFAPYWSTDGYIYFSSDRVSFPHHYNIWRFKIPTN
ncbi:MAG: PD40 domain-containing protein [Candidatus Delongbacteria bacterium]|nr:PD40 domain-containing protein [Candidatus Delongbacteria bacterium]